MAHKRLEDIIPARSSGNKRPSAKKAAPSSVRGKDRKEPHESAAGTSRGAGGGLSKKEAAQAPGGKPKRPKKGGFKKRLALLGIACVALVAIFGFAFSSLFAQSVVTVTPKTREAHLDATLLAYRGEEEREDAVPFELMLLEDAESRDVPATEVKQVERRASGKIVIYNDYNKQSQRLIKNTRFETPDGSIYRIRDSVVVPGQTTQNGEVVPGSIEVTVYADAPGEEYNKPPQDFTIPGFAGTPRYDAFYARSKTPLSGGFEGVVKTASEETLSEVRTELKNTLRTRLAEKAQAQKPGDFVLFPQAIFIQFSEETEEPQQANPDAESVTLNQQAKLYGVIFEKKALSQHLAGTLLSGESDPEQARIQNYEDLNFSFIDKEHFTPSEDSQFSFSLSGEARFAWAFDADALKAQLAGLDREKARGIFSGFPGIAKAEVALRPFWKRTFPNEPKDILVEPDED